MPTNLYTHQACSSSAQTFLDILVSTLTCRSMRVEDSPHKPEDEHDQDRLSPSLSPHANARLSDPIRPKAMNPSLTSQEAQRALRTKLLLVNGKKKPGIRASSTGIVSSTNDERAIKAQLDCPRMAQTNGQVPRASSTTDMAGLRQLDKDAPKALIHTCPGEIKKNASLYKACDLLEWSQMARIRINTSPSNTSVSRDVQKVQSSSQDKPSVSLNGGTNIPSCPSYAAIHPGDEKLPLMAVGMPDAGPHTDISPLHCAPAASPPVHDMEAPHLTTKEQQLEGKNISRDEEMSDMEHSPVAQTAPAPHSQSLASSMRAISPRPQQDENQPSSQNKPNKKTPAPCSSPYAVTCPDAGRQPLTPARMPGTHLHTDTSSLRHVLVTSCPVHREMLSSMTKQLLERKVVNKDEETRVKGHSPSAPAALSLPIQMPVASTQAIAHHPPKDGPKPSFIMAPKRCETANTINTKPTHPARTSSMTRQPVGGKVISDDEQSAAQRSPETETSPRRLPVSSLVAPKRSTGVVNQKLTVSINAHPTTKFGAQSKVPNKAIKRPDVGSASPDKIRPLRPPDRKTPPMTRWPDEVVVSKRHTDMSQYPAKCHKDAQELRFEPPEAGQRLAKRQSQAFPFPGEVGER
jgi:hypothetical protein